MDWNCKQLEGLLPDLAEGKDIPEATVHLKSCPDCAMKLEHFRTIFRASNVPVVQAPARVIQNAKSLQIGRKVVIRAKLFGSSLALAQARSTAANFQLVVGSNEH